MLEILVASLFLQEVESTASSRSIMYILMLSPNVALYLLKNSSKGILLFVHYQYFYKDYYRRLMPKDVFS